jgi:hypothetical protein
VSERNNEDSREEEARDFAAQVREWMQRNPREAEEMVSDIFGAGKAAPQPADAEDVAEAANIIDQMLVEDPANPPNVRMVTGYEAASSKAGTVRLYNGLDFDQYLEIPEDAIHERLRLPIEREVEGFAYTKLWLKIGHHVTRVRRESFEVKQRFLRGDVAGHGPGACGCGRPKHCSCGRAYDPCGPGYHAYGGSYGSAVSDDPLAEEISRSPC